MWFSRRIINRCRYIKIFVNKYLYLLSSGSREIPELLKVLGFENGYYDENNHEWVTEFLPSEDLTHSDGSIVQGGFVTGMLDAAMAQCIMFKSNGEDLPLTLDIDVKFLNSCIPNHKVTSLSLIHI